MAHAPRERSAEPAPDTRLLTAAYVAGVSVLLALGGLVRLIRAVPRQMGRRVYSPVPSPSSASARLNSAVANDLASLRCTFVLDGAPWPRLRANAHQLVHHDEVATH